MKTLRSRLLCIALAACVLPAIGCSRSSAFPGAYERSKETAQSRELSRKSLKTSRRYLEFALEHEYFVRVKPWERDILSRQDMGWSADTLQSSRRSHIFFSKEASLGGGSVGGGGCGCN